MAKEPLHCKNQCMCYKCCVDRGRLKDLHDNDKRRRDLFAAAALQGLLAGLSSIQAIPGTPAFDGVQVAARLIPTQAKEYADALLAALEEVVDD